MDRFLAGEIDFDTLSSTLRAAASKSADARARVEDYLDEAHTRGDLSRQLKHALRAGLDTSRRARRLPGGMGGRSPLADLVGDAKAASELAPASLFPRDAKPPARSGAVPREASAASVPLSSAPEASKPAAAASPVPPPARARREEARAAPGPAATASIPAEPIEEEWAPSPRARVSPTGTSPPPHPGPAADLGPARPVGPTPAGMGAAPHPSPDAAFADDEPTIPLLNVNALVPVARLGDHAPAVPTQRRGMRSVPSPSEPARDVEARVQDAYLTNYLSRFTASRGGDGPTETTKREDEHVDRLLASWKSIRDRRSAREAVAGRVNGAEPRLPTAAIMPLRVGSVLKDRFVLEAELGGGGVGRVFKAVDRRKLEAGSREPYVAIKVLRERLARDPDAVRALEHEARKTQSLSHPNIVNIHDFDRDGARVFMAMELIEGRSLAQALAQWPADGQALDDAAPVLRGIGAGLAHAHANGFAHADVKPANVMLLTDGRVKLLDFGLVAALRGAGAPAEAAMDGLTPLYASPERLAGAGPSICDDMFAFGSVAYRILSGRHPFGRQPADEAERAGLLPRDIERLGPAANAALRAALAFDPSERTPTVGAFVSALLEDD